MKRLALRSIRIKLLLAFAVLALGPLVVLGVMSTREGIDEMTSTAGHTLQGRADIAENAMAAYLDERHGDVKVFALNQVAQKGVPAEVAALADLYVRTFAEYDLIVVADRDGKILATNTVTGDRRPVEQALVGASVRGQAWFDAISAGRLAHEAPFVGAAQTDTLVAQAIHGDAMGVTIAIGIYDDNGQLGRVWSNHISWRRGFGRVVDEQVKQMTDSGIATAQVDLIDATGRILQSSPPNPGTTNLNLVTAGSSVATKVLAGGEGYARELDAIDHEADVVGYSPLHARGSFAANGWAFLVHENASEVVASTHGLRDYALLVTVFAAAFVVIGALWFARSLTKPVRGIMVALERVAAGDLTARAEVAGEDELAQMTHALHSALDRLGVAFSTIGDGVIALARASEELGLVGNTLNASADDTSRQAGLVAAASEQVGKNVQTVATGTEEMSVTIKEIAKHTTEAARVATAAVGRAQHTNDLVGKLGESSNEIGNVLKVITSIAEQTNLLALNATIEAARAGEAGKGFAVVANEVKELAKETARATEDITRKIGAIQSDTTSAVTAIGAISTVIDQINDIQNSIASAVEEQAATTNEIGRNLHELAQASNDIALNVTAVAVSAGSTAACSTETRTAADQLSALSRSLDAQMRRFTYTRQDGAPAPRQVTGTLVRIPPAISLAPTTPQAKSSGLRH